MTTQDLKTRLFTTVVRGLLTQNGKSVDERGECKYRGGLEGQLRCGVGFLISDKQYSPKLEDCGACDAAVLNAIARSLGEPREEISALSELLFQVQVTHDSFNADQWERELREVAINNDLNWDGVMRQIKEGHVD